LTVAEGEELVDIASEGNPEGDSLVEEEDSLGEGNHLGVDTPVEDTEAVGRNNHGWTS